jgi:hypothetical protein
MRNPQRLLFKLIVRPFYSENSGAFILIFTVLFYIVGQVEDAGLFEFHYSLIKGILHSNMTLSMVIFLWLFYAHKCSQFTLQLINSSEYSFLQIYNLLGRFKRMLLLLKVQVWLMLPILLYAVAVAIVGWAQGKYLKMIAIVLSLSLSCLAAALFHVYKLERYHEDRNVIRKRKKFLEKFKLFYPSILIQLIVTNLKLSWTGVKVLSCVLFYLIARNNSDGRYEIDLVFVFFNLTVLANGILIYKLRNFENVYLSFYRGLSVSKLRRFLQYALVVLLILLPEAVLVKYLTPKYLEYWDAVGIFMSGYTLLLLINSFSFVDDYKVSDFVKLLLILFCFQYLLYVLVNLTVLNILCALGSAALFAITFYRFEKANPV